MTITLPALCGLLIAVVSVCIWLGMRLEQWLAHAILRLNFDIACKTADNMSVIITILVRGYNVPAWNDDVKAIFQSVCCSAVVESVSRMDGAHLFNETIELRALLLSRLRQAYADSKNGKVRLIDVFDINVYAARSE
jgi:hypothetical protein